jgi:hypothetical protein
MRVLIVLLIVWLSLSSLGTTQAQDANQTWRLLTTTVNNTVYYSPSSQTHTNDKTEKAWAKLVPLDINDARHRLVEERSQDNLPLAGFEKLAYTLQLYELNCTNNQLRLRLVVYYKADGQVIDSENYPSNEWIDTVPESFGAQLLQVTCDDPYLVALKAKPKKRAPKRRVKHDHAQTSKGNPLTKVWVNSSSHVYHCPGTKYYGNTKHGEYMTQKQAQDKRDRPAYGKPCK